MIARLLKEGDGQSIQLACKYGLSNVFLRASQDTIRSTLLQSVEVAALRYEEKRKA